MNPRRLLIVLCLGLLLTGCGRFTRVYVGNSPVSEVKLELTPYRGCILTQGIPIAGLYETHGDRITVTLPTGQRVEFRREGDALVAEKGLGPFGPVTLRRQ